MVFWQLVDSKINGLFVAAVILDNITNLGQVQVHVATVTICT